MSAQLPQIEFTDAPEQALADPQTLALIAFNVQGADSAAHGSAAPGGDARYVDTGLVLLPAGSGGPSFGLVQGEWWRSAGTVTHGVLDEPRGDDTGTGVRYAYDADYLLLHRRVGRSGNLSEAARDTYRQLTRTGSRLGYPHALRMWNYLDAINDGEGDAERYRQFCVGRAEGFAPQSMYPAATCIGRNGDALLAYALFGRRPGHHVENPHQVSAYRYPREYGPASPSFARGTRITQGTQTLVFVSGTAAILGHLSQHENDLRAQLDLALDNVQRVLSAANTPATARLQLKAYVRNAHLARACAETMNARFAAAPCALLHADICRRELLVEVEAWAYW